jgi:transcriptional regulator with XRE-family HTH domain
MAREIDISNASLSRIENGLQGITPDVLPKLVKYTGIPAAALCPDLAKMFLQAAE